MWLNGYEVVAPPPGSKEAGERRIVPPEADVVRRIYREYAAGKSPRHIARDLNAESIPGPGGRPWGDTRIRGQVDRGTGILNNTLYIGRLSWNRCSYIKDPRTGRRVARIKELEKLDELAASVAILNEGMDLAGEQVDTSQQADGAVACDALVSAGHPRQVRCRLADRLHARFLVVADITDIAAWRSPCNFFVSAGAH